MNWEAIGAIGEIIGAIAVVITLVYLAAQLRTNTTAINRSASQEVIQGRGEMSRFLASDSELSSLFWRGAATPESLDSNEWQRFYFIVNAVIRPIELGFLDHVEGRMSKETWIGQEASVLYWVVQPGRQKWIAEFGQTLNSQFLTYLNETISKHNAKSNT